MPALKGENATHMAASDRTETKSVCGGCLGSRWSRRRFGHQTAFFFLFKLVRLHCRCLLGLAMLVRLAIGVILFLLPTSIHAQAEKRIALLIGNRDYKPGVGALINPLNDIRIVGEALQAVGFEVMKPVQNATRARMLRAILEFTAQLKVGGPDAVGFLYYSGHGIASAGENYLIPVDAEEPSTIELSVHGVKHSEVLAILRGEAPNAAHYLVLDACRNTLQGARGGKGFVPIRQQSGVLVAFATEPGKAATDLGQGSGPYAAALATELVKPAQNDLLMFHNVRVAVMDKTNGDQVPWTEDGIQRRHRVLFGGQNIPKSAAPTRLSEAAEAWDRVKDATNVDVLEAFLARYKDTFYGDLARARIQELNKQPGASPLPKHEQPTTIVGMLKCDTYSERATCDSDTNCSWADNWKQCQRRSGSLSTALLEASPPSNRVLEPNCAGVVVRVGNERQCLGAKESFSDCPECPEMVVVPAGEFVMGSPPDEFQREEHEGPQHRVKIAKAFAVGKFEVTLEEWRTCVAAGGCRQKVRYEGNDSKPHPVINVSWHDAVEYITWLSTKTAKRYRFLTEAEWEYAARAGSKHKYTWGAEIGENNANCDGCGSQWDNLKTAPVGSFKTNAFGLLDVHGNVWEWVQDCYRGTYRDAPSDGSAMTSDNCEQRVIRSGSWKSKADGLRASSRAGVEARVRVDFIGFRLARGLEP